MTIEYDTYNMGCFMGKLQHLASDTRVSISSVDKRVRGVLWEDDRKSEFGHAGFHVHRLTRVRGG